MNINTKNTIDSARFSARPSGRHTTTVVGGANIAGSRLKLDFMRTNQTILSGTGQNSLDGTIDSVMDSRRNGEVTVIRDPQVDKFNRVIDAKIQEFRTLKQLEQTLSKQTPRITNRNYRVSETIEHGSTKKLAMQVKQYGKARCSSNQKPRTIPKNAFDLRAMSPVHGQTNQQTLQMSSVIASSRNHSMPAYTEFDETTSSGKPLTNFTFRRKRMTHPKYHTLTIDPTDEVNKRLLEDVKATLQSRRIEELD